MYNFWCLITQYIAPNNTDFGFNIILTSNESILSKPVDFKNDILSYEYGFSVENNRVKYLVDYVNEGRSKDKIIDI